MAVITAVSLLFTPTPHPHRLQSALEDLPRGPREKKVAFDVSESDLSSSAGRPDQRGDPAVLHLHPSESCLCKALNPSKECLKKEL